MNIQILKKRRKIMRLISIIFILICVISIIVQMICFSRYRNETELIILLMRLFTTSGFLALIFVLLQDMYDYKLKIQRKNQKNKLTADDFKKVKIDFDYNFREISKIISAKDIVETFAKVENLDGSTIVIKTVYSGDDKLKTEKESRIDRGSVEFLEVQS